MRLSGLILAAASLFVGSSTSFALVDVEALVGKRWYSTKITGDKTNGVSSQEIGLAVHLDPIPLIPVGFGVGVLSGTLNKDDLKGIGFDEGSVMEVDFEVKAWIPMIPIVTPYVKVKVPLMSRVALKGKQTVNNTEQDVAALVKLTGYHTNVGIQYSIIPLVSLTLEAGKGMQKSEIEEYKVASVNQDKSIFKKENANSDNVMLGVQIGF